MVIKWFRNIKNKNLDTFTVFEAQEFYPFIGEKLLKYTVLFAQTHISISRKDIEVIFHGHRSLLFHDNEPCTKKIAMVTSMSPWEVTREQKCAIKMIKFGRR